jgi:hypothetical protein
MGVNREAIGKKAGSAHRIGREACPRLAAAAWSGVTRDLEGDAAVRRAAGLREWRSRRRAACDVTKASPADAAVSAIERGVPPVAVR